MPSVMKFYVPFNEGCVNLKVKPLLHVRFEFRPHVVCLELRESWEPKVPRSVGHLNKP